MIINKAIQIEFFYPLMIFEWTLLCRFNGEEFLRRHRGKSILFVGDSLSLNQWQSLTCMLHTAVPQAQYTLVRIGGLSIFTFPVRSLFPSSSHSLLQNLSYFHKSTFTPITWAMSRWLCFPSLAPNEWLQNNK